MGNAPRYKSLRGMPDILPREAQVMQWVEAKAREVFKKFGYSEIRTPLLEETDLFIRSIGQDTDIVEKEMYSFQDQGERQISLRPEGTASIIRAYIENNLYASGDIVKLFYIGPMFRAERPQKGRLRQFYQIGAEIIGGESSRLSFIDAELIYSLYTFLLDLKLKDFTILLNSLGCKKDRINYKKELAVYLEKSADSLCDNCKRRSKTNVLRVLDCKSEGCKGLLKKAPVILDYLCKTCQDDYEKLKDILQKRGVDFQERKTLVRGLDYYTGAIFEVSSSLLGGQDAIAAGGRYDGLSVEMGGPDVNSSGYAIGLDRLVLTIDKKEIPNDSTSIYIVSSNDALYEDAFHVANNLRKNGIACSVDLSGRSFKGQMRKADKENARFVIIVGEGEKKQGKVLFKDMTSGDERLLSLEEVVKWGLPPKGTVPISADGK